MTDRAPDRGVGMEIPWWQQPGERVLWEGRPDPRVVFSKQDLYLVPFSLVFSAIAVSILLTPGSGGAGGDLIMVPFLAVGLYLLVGRFFYQRYNRRRTRYVVTDRRALEIRTDGGLLKEASAASAPMRVERHRDGRRGSIVWTLAGPYPTPSSPRGFGSLQLLGNTGWPGGNRTGLAELAFLDVNNFDSLVAVVNSVRSGAAAAAPSPSPAADLPVSSSWPPASPWPGAPQVQPDRGPWGRWPSPRMTAPLFVAGLVGAVLLGAFVVHRLTPYLNPELVTAPGTTTMHLVPGTYVIFAHPVENGRPVDLCPLNAHCLPFGPASVTVVGPNDVHPRVVADVTSDRLNEPGVTYPGVVEFQVAQAGIYRIDVSPGHSDTIAVNPSPGQEVHAFAGWIALGAVILIVILGSFVCLLGARRARRRSALVSPGAVLGPWTGH